MKRRSTKRPPSPAIVGAQVLQNLKKGRTRLRALNEERKARSELVKRLIAELALTEEWRGCPQRGRAGRISRKLNGLIGERMVQKYLEQLASGSD